MTSEQKDKKDKREEEKHDLEQKKMSLEYRMDLVINLESLRERYDYSYERIAKIFPEMVDVFPPGEKQKFVKDCHSNSEGIKDGQGLDSRKRHRSQSTSAGSRQSNRSGPKERTTNVVARASRGTENSDSVANKPSSSSILASVGAENNLNNSVDSSDTEVLAKNIGYDPQKKNKHNEPNKK
jgi:hypothetical protein